jgi:hypothetical protein
VQHEYGPGSALFRVMNNVWQARCRALLEQLEALAHQLRIEQQIPPTALEEQTVRLVVGVIMVLRQHRVNKLGQCTYCAWTSRTWSLWHRRPQCTVYLSLDFAMSQPLDLVWGSLLADHQRPQLR